MKLSSSLRFITPSENPRLNRNTMQIGGLLDGRPQTIQCTDDMYPHFYVDTDEYRKHFGNKVDGNLVRKLEDTDLKSVGGIPVSKLYYKMPKFGTGLQSQLESVGIRTFEADLRYSRQLLLNKKFEMDYGNRWRFIDIETDDSRNDINLKDYGSIKILSVSISDGKKNDWYFWNDFAGGEKEMLQEIYTKFLNERVGALYGWNVRFDVGHIEARMAKYGLSLPYRFSFLDMLEKYKFEVKGLGSYSLKEVTEHEGMAEKKLHRTQKVSKMSRDDLEKYNRRDVDVLATLDDKYGFSMLYNQLAKDVNLPLELTAAGNIGDQLILERLRELGYVGINMLERDTPTYSGAYVKQPPPGLFRNVGVYDFTALYPNIIIHNNVDILNFNGRVVPHILRNLLSLREEYKRKFAETGDIKWDTMQKAIKPKTNALYGLFGYKFARFYDREKAEFTTTKGRIIILSLIKYVEQVLGGRVMYTDTDSVFIDLESFGGPKYAPYVTDLINKKMKPFEIKLEYVLDKLIFPVSLDGKAPKKRYVGVYEKKDKKTGNIKEEWTIRGIEMRRGDRCMLTKKTQENVIKMIFEGKNRYEILDYLHEIKRNLYDGKYDELLTITKSLKSEKDSKVMTPQLRAFKMLQEMTGTKRFDTKVSYILVRNKEGVYPRDEDVQDNPKPDYKRYWENEILPPSQRMLNALPDTQQKKLI